MLDLKEGDALREVMTLCGLVTPIVAFVFIGIATWIHGDWFTWTGHALSDLGARSAEHDWIYNLGLLTTGTLGIIFTLRLIDFLESTVTRIGLVVFMLGIFSLSTVGVFHGSHELHMTATNLFFGLSTLGVFIVGIGESIRRDSLGYFWIVLVIVGVILGYLTSQWFEGAAIPEMVGAVVYSIFSAGYYLRIKEYI